MALALCATASNVGKNWGVERSSYSDPVTGLRVVEITRAAAGITDNMYFVFPNFTADNRYLLFVSERAGSMQLFRMTMDSGEIVQLTDDPAVDARTACPDRRDARIIYYLRGQDVMRMDVISFEARKIAAIPGPSLGDYSQLTQSGDGRYLTTSKQRDQHNWEIGVIDLNDGSYKTVLTQGFRIAHIQHSPVAPVLFYIWETNTYNPQHTWFVNRDGSGNRPLYYATDPAKWITPLKEWVMHETFIPATGEMTFVMDRIGLMIVKPDGSARLVAGGSFWHCAPSPDGSKIVADDQQGRIWLADVNTGNLRLLATGFQDKVKGLHAHPSFDRTGRWVVFHSGRSHETVALIDLDQIGKN